MSEETHPDDDSYIVRVKAVVMTRDDSSGGWLAQEGGGLSRVGVCKVAPNDLELLGRHGFLIYGERLKDKQAILECFLRKDLVYTKATPTFHHWRVDNQKCGLTFQSPADARAFDRGVRKAIEDLTEGSTTSSSTIQNETELGDDDVFTNATDSSSSSSHRREPALHTLAPINLCESRRHNCIMGHFYDQHRLSDHYFVDQPVPVFPRHVSFQLDDPEEEIVRINPRERAWLSTGYEDYRHAHPAAGGRYGNKPLHHPSPLAALRPLHHLHHPHLHDPFGPAPFLPITDPDAYVHFDKSDPPKHDYTYPYPSGGGVGGGGGGLGGDGGSDPHRTEGKKAGGGGGGGGGGRGVAVVTGQPRGLQSKWKRGLGTFAGFGGRSSSHHHDIAGVGSGSSSSVAVGIAGGIVTGGERARCVYCRDLFRREDNRRGHCTEAPDPVRTCIRRVSFMWCADSLLYHCMSDPEGDYSDPCSCDATEERFWLRWAALLGLSLLAPCMCCYGPLRACHRCGVAIHCCGGKHKAVG
ncbi:sprouty-related, EVH1 domain-containing protein 2 [Clupea harengus]|uniref:Sprouty-related, EVH1 domain-containing protein 2 n=1 Tax=Clupea harengus TaxID=7950 RepID=A0A6P8F4G2_CLUHA|nr:sprouty-related, EVH1 domain-containing protein 2 [Clupea harengus]